MLWENSIGINMSKANYVTEIHWWPLYTLTLPERGSSTAGPCEFNKIFNTVHSGKRKKQSAGLCGCINNSYRAKVQDICLL